MQSLLLRVCIVCGVSGELRNQANSSDDVSKGSYKLKLADQLTAGVNIQADFLYPPHQLGAERFMSL